MLPFTTYHVPDERIALLPKPGHWLWLVLPQSTGKEDSSMLGKMAGALKADMEHEVFPLHLANSEAISISDIATPGLKLIISFGIDPSQLGLWIDLNTPGLRVLENFCFILTLPLSQLATNTTAKKELWHAMQTYMELYARSE